MQKCRHTQHGEHQTRFQSRSRREWPIKISSAFYISRIVLGNAPREKTPSTQLLVQKLKELASTSASV